MSQEKRKPNFEVMRTVAMFFIVVYHCLTHGVGGQYVFSVSEPVSLLNLTCADLLLVFSSISVNLYVMVSGYFLADLEFKLSRMVRTWLKAMFYSVIITVLFMSLSLVPFSMIQLGKSFFPISTDAYWFVTQYIGLLILSPFLGHLARQLSYRQYVGLLIGGTFLCLALIPDFPLGKRFHVAHGNSLWSFAYLFMIAGFIRYHLQKISMRKLLSAIVFVVLLTITGELLLGRQNDGVHLYWFNYNALPFVLSVLMFVLIRQMLIPETGIWHIMVKVAPYTFGVYLVHDHLLIREWLWKTVALPTWCDKWLFPLIVVGLCLIIFLIGVLIDFLRKQFFTLCKIDSTVAKLDHWSFYTKLFT